MEVRLISCLILILYLGVNDYKKRSKRQKGRKAQAKHSGLVSNPEEILLAMPHWKRSEGKRWITNQIIGGRAITFIGISWYDVQDYIEKYLQGVHVHQIVRKKTVYTCYSSFAVTRGIACAMCTAPPI